MQTSEIDYAPSQKRCCSKSPSVATPLPIEGADDILAVEAHEPAPPRLPQPLPSASRRKETRYDQEFEPQSESDDQR